MPVIKSAKKKLRQDKKRTERNRDLKTEVKSLLKKAMKEKSAASVQAFFKATDKAAKNHILHKNKAARLKSRVSKLLTSHASAKASAQPAKKTKKPASK
ncbi:MAG: 30S ribosomal protein S20 [Patescibacteria group bacterium]|nr:30S ribosomal protein S20 [Patescibacteria group bacterium]